MIVDRLMTRLLCLQELVCGEWQEDLLLRYLRITTDHRDRHIACLINRLDQQGRIPRCRQCAVPALTCPCIEFDAAPVLCGRIIIGDKHRFNPRWITYV